MPDLVAQGRRPEDRWRHPLPADESLILGRGQPGWSAPWEPHLSRAHAELRYSSGLLHVRQLPTARNAIYFEGGESREFDVPTGAQFVIGQTTFRLVDDLVTISAHLPAPVDEQTFTTQYLRRIRYRNPDQRIEVLSRLIDVISGATSDAELHVRLVNVLLAGIARADAVALMAPREHADGYEILYWDRRFTTTGDLVPSQRLISAALGQQKSVLHLWGGGGRGSESYTMRAEFDWAFCTPVPGRACSGWAIYVTGRFASPGDAGSPSVDSVDLRDDLKFTELVAAVLGELRHSRRLQQRQASLAHFFAPTVLRALENEAAATALEPREANVTVLFCDLRGFSKQIEQEAEDLLGVLERVSRALGVMTHHILEKGGVIGDFHGDAAMGFWGWPLAQEDTVQRAACAALAIAAEFRDESRQAKAPLSDFRVGIGIATGRAVAGKIGTVDQVKVTVFGPVVNLAARLEGMTKILRAPILLDETTAQLVRQRVAPELARVRRVALIRPYGLEQPLTVSELLPPGLDGASLTNEQVDVYETALDAFIAGDWPRAYELLHRVPADDEVKDFLTGYILQHRRLRPAWWDGVIPLESKT